MSSRVVDCPEAAGKTVKSLKLYSDESKIEEIILEFTDGTSFTASYECQVKTEAKLILTGTGAPELVKNYLD